MGAGSGFAGWLLLLLLLPALSSCETRQCTEIGCSDGASLTLKTTAGTLPDGTYTLSFSVDGQPYTCSFTAPDGLPREPGRIGAASCDAGFRLNVLPELVCTEYRTGDAVSQSCTPVPDRWYFAATLEGTPAELTVAVERDGVALLDEHRTLAYRDEYPNGPECDPVCRQASAALLLSD